MAAYGSLYSLTPMTGRTSGSERTTVIGTVEMKWRTFWVSTLSLVPGGILSAMFYPFVNVWAFLWLPILMGGAFYLIERRSTDGLKLRTYEGLLDKKKSSVNQFFLCGQPIEVGAAEFGTIRQITVPVRPVDGSGNHPADSRTKDFEEFIR
ncbi:MAG TPA: hypothetical protein VF867_10045 [Arthrobacter sp.]